jgi:hypothetical protein
MKRATRLLAMDAPRHPIDVWWVAVTAACGERVAQCASAVVAEINDNAVLQ